MAVRIPSMEDRQRRRRKVVKLGPSDVLADASVTGRRIVRMLVFLTMAVALASVVTIYVTSGKAPHDGEEMISAHEGIPISPAPVSEPEPLADELFTDSVEAFRQHDPERAMTLAESARARCDDDHLLPKISNLLGIIHHEKGRYPEAVAEFLTAIRHDRKNAGYYFNWAEALRAEGHPDAAIPPMQQAALLRPNDSLTQIKLGFLLIESGQAEMMADQINQLSKDGNLKIELAFVKAALLRLSDQESEFNELLEKLKKTVPAELYELCLMDPLFRKKRLIGVKGQNYGKEIE